MIDPLAAAHLGVLRSTSPPRGTQPQRDTMFDAQLGWLALVDAGASIDDESFCVALVDDQSFCRK